MFNKKYIKFIAVGVGIVILTAYYQISNFANNITNQSNEIKTSNIEKVDHIIIMDYFTLVKIQNFLYHLEIEKL